MATLILSTVGTMLGGPIGGLLGSLVGQGIDQQLLGGGARKGPRLGDLSVQTSSYGSMIPRIYGTMRVAGTVVWATDLKESSDLQGDGKSQPEMVVYTYSASFAVALSSRRAVRIKRIWADGKLLRGAAGDFKVSTKFRFLPGTEGQAVDPLIASVEGASSAPAYRGVALAVFEDLQLAEFGNRIPSITFELEADEGGAELGGLLLDASGGAIDCNDERIVPGYAAHGQDVGAALAPLVEAFAIELRDEGDGIRSPPILPPRSAQERELGASSENLATSAIDRSKAPAATIPASLTLTYYDPSRDYQAGQARTSIPAPGRVSRQMPLPCVLGAGIAKAMAETLIARDWAMRDQIRVRLASTFLDLAPGQVVSLPGVYGNWIVERLTIERFVVDAILRPAWRSAGDRLADPGRGLPQPDVVAAPSRLVLLDLPDLGLGNEMPTLHLAAASPSGGWRPVPITIGINGATTSAQSAAGEAIVGTAQAALGIGQPFVLDLVNSLEVQLANRDQWLLSSDDAALADGANLAMVGDELIQFGGAEPIGAGFFRLTRLLRGRRGSEWAMAGHVPGEPFVLVEAGSLKPIAIAPEMMGAVVTVTAYGPANEESPPNVTRPATGEALRPLSPAHLSAIRQADGSVTVEWVRRSHQGWAWVDYVDAPPDPSFQGFRVNAVGTGSAIERDVGVENALLSTADLAALGTGTIDISVRQIGWLAASRPAILQFDNS